MRSGTHKLMPASACVRGKIVSELSATAINGKSAMPTQTFSSFEAYFDANRHSRVRGMVLGREREARYCSSGVMKPPR